MLDSQLQKLLEASAGAPDLCDLPIEAARALYSQICTAADFPLADVEIEQRAIAGPGGELGLRIYRPRGTGARGVVLYLHGGGFALGSPRDYDGVCSLLCARSDCVVVQVDYRLAPEHPFPAAVDDCYAALEWLGHHAQEIGGDPNCIAAAGDSAGANLAAVMAILARERKGPAIRLQALIYPVTAPVPEMFDSYRRAGEGYTLTTRATWHFTECYLGSRQPTRDWRAAPLLASDLRDLPPALVLVAGYDPLHDEGVAYADKLAAAGNHVMLIDYPGLAHGFFTMGGAVGASRLAVLQVAAALRDSLSA